MNSPVTVRPLGADVMLVRLDDGRANALDSRSIGRLSAEFEALAQSDRAVVLAGRPGFFSAGLDRGLLESARASERRSTLRELAALLAQVLVHPRPVVAAAGGHALAAGMLLASCADYVVAADGAWRWGLVETRAGLAHEPFGVAVARYRLGPAADTWALAGDARSVSEARNAGIVDRVVPSESVETAALDRAQDLASIPADAYRATKAQLRSDLHALLRNASAEGVDAA